MATVTPSGRPKREYSQVIIAFLGVLAAFFAAFGAYFGFRAHQSDVSANQAHQVAAAVSSSLQTAQSKNSVLVQAQTINAGALGSASSQAAVANSQVDVAASSIAGLNSSIAALQDQNSSLSSELAIATISGPSAIVTATGNPVPRHTGNLILAANGEQADLDANQDNPQWTVVGNGSQTDILFNSAGAVQVLNGAEILVLGSVKSGYASCRGTSGYNLNTIPYADLKPKEFLCVKTDQKRYAALEVVSSTVNGVALSVVTYDPPDAN